MTTIIHSIAEIEAAISTATSPITSALASAFSETKQSAPNDRWDLLIQIFQMMLRAKNLAEPFAPMFVSGNRRSILPDDLSADHLAALSSVFPGPDHPGYRSRVGDVLWRRKRDVQAGEMAADAYLRLCQLLAASPFTYDAGAHFERGVRLAMQVNKNGQQVKQHFEQIHAQAMAVDPAVAGRLSTDLLTILYDLRYGDAAALGQRSMVVGAAKRAMAHHPAARTAYELAARFFHRAQQAADAEVARVASAETYIEEADGFGDGLGAHESIRTAILAYQKIPSCRDRIPALQERLRAAGKSAVSSMVTFDHKEDITPLVDATRNSISGATFINALFRLAFITPLLARDGMRSQVEKLLNDNPLQGIFATTVFDAAGRTVAVVPGMLGGSPEEVERGMQYHIHRHASLARSVSCAACIGPAIGIINSEHIFDDADLESVLQDHPLIPDGQMPYFAKGVTAGLKGDFAEALHLLVPQIENSLRIILFEEGVITTDLTKAGIEHEWMLGRVLSQPTIENCLGPMFVFELKSLMLADPAGSNIRNTLAHGLLPFPSTRSVDCVYLWWVILRLLLYTSPQYEVFGERKRNDIGAS